MKITYDSVSDSLYIQLREGEVDDTLAHSKYIFTDVDGEGTPLGIEILYAKQLLGEGNLATVTVDFVQSVPQN